MPRILLKLDLLTPSQNVTDREHWRARGRRLRDMEWHLLAAASVAEGGRRRPPLGTMVSVHITRSSCQLLDHGNLVGGCKQLVDALVRLGFATDDSPDYMAQHYSQAKVARRAEQGTTVAIEWPGE